MADILTGGARALNGLILQLTGIAEDSSTPRKFDKLQVVATPQLFVNPFAVLGHCRCGGGVNLG
jgi:hypothetical protein